jgi:chaperonin GroES
MQKIYTKKIKVLQDRVLVEVIITENEKTPGGLIIPKKPGENEKSALAKVIRIGKDVNIEPVRLLDDTEIKSVEEIWVPDINMGDTIIFDKYAGNPLVIDEKVYIILKADDILAVIED